MTLPLIIV